MHHDIYNNRIITTWCLTENISNNSNIYNHNIHISKNIFGINITYKLLCILPLQYWYLPKQLQLQLQQQPRLKKSIQDFIISVYKIFYGTPPLPRKLFPQMQSTRKTLTWKMYREINFEFPCLRKKLLQ